MRRKNVPSKTDSELSRRERQIMDVLFARGRATGPEIQEGLADKPNYSSVRTILRVLERKGYVRHLEEGLRYVYEPTVAREAAFHLSESELSELARMVDRVKKERK